MYSKCLITMIVEVSKSAVKDIQNLTKEAQKKVLDEIVSLREKESLGSMGNVIKMKGINKPPAFRLKIGNFRIMIEKKDTHIVIRSISDRKDAYKKR